MVKAVKAKIQIQKENSFKKYANIQNFTKMVRAETTFKLKADFSQTMSPRIPL